MLQKSSELQDKTENFQTNSEEETSWHEISPKWNILTCTDMCKKLTNKLFWITHEQHCGLVQSCNKRQKNIKWKTNVTPVNEEVFLLGLKGNSSSILSVWMFWRQGHISALENTMKFFYALCNDAENQKICSSYFWKCFKKHVKANCCQQLKWTI